MNFASFHEKLRTKWNEGKFVCVGLDSDYSKLPSSIKSGSAEDAIFNFNKAIIDYTHDLVCAFKLQISFYEAEGVGGWKALERTVKYIHQTYSEIPVILDAKRADIGSSNKGYTKIYFDEMGFDAITVNPYLGKESLAPFLEYKDKGIIILVKTSNPGSDEFQGLKIEGMGEPLYQIITQNIVQKWNENGNCAVVVGATYSEELKKVREIVGDMPILIPGIGAQGGDLRGVVEAGKDSHNQGMIINASRSIIFASSGEDFAEAARAETEKLHNQIKEFLELSS